MTPPKAPTTPDLVTPWIEAEAAAVVAVETAIAGMLGVNAVPKSAEEAAAEDAATEAEFDNMPL